MTDRRVVVISGGSRGLGQALVERFLQTGAVVATFSRRSSEFVQRTVQSPEWRPRFEYREMDVTDAVAVRQFVNDLYHKHQRIDVLVNNAGVAYDGTLATFPAERIRQIIDINLTASLLLTKACVRFMLLRSSGRIINISSIVGQRGFSGLSAYSATKAALLGMTHSLARELGPRRITVNAVAPGYLATEMSEALTEPQRQQIIRRTPLGRLGSAEDVAGVVEFLASDAAQFITGQVIVVDGGLSC